MSRLACIRPCFVRQDAPSGACFVGQINKNEVISLLTCQPDANMSKEI